MLRQIQAKNLGTSNLGWLQSRFHFSFAEYHNPKAIQFGVLRVINDDLVQPGTGFDLHPHRDMEIISYVVDGELTHADNMGNRQTLTRGQVQYMSAGTGVYHSEHNLGTGVARFLQIWIFPDQRRLEPNYGDYRFRWEDRRDRWLQLVSGQEGNAPVKVHQDVSLSALELEAGKEIALTVGPGRQAYLVQIEGSSELGSVTLEPRDGLEIVEEDLVLKAKTASHVLVIEMAKTEVT